MGGTLPPEAARTRFPAAAAAVLATGAALRVLASRGDLWLDEIWSLMLVRRAGGPLDVLAIAHDNSHPLNSLYLYLLGDHAPQAAYRALALASGLAAIVAALCIGRRQGRVGSLLAGGAFAISFPMVVYASEARGYMPAVAAALWAFLLAERVLATPSWHARAAFWLASVAGLLSHYAFAQVLLAIGVWSAWHLVLGAPDRRAGLRAVLAMQVVPLLALGILYATVLSRVRMGGGPRLPLETLVGQTIGWTLGLPVAGIGDSGGTLLVVAVVAVVAAESAALHRSGDDSWIFLASVVLVLPAVVLALRPPLLYPRYFLLNAAFLLLALASATARLVRRGGLARAGALLVVLVFCAGNAARDLQFLRDGRGDYRAALTWMARQSQRPRVLVTGSNDFAVRREIAYHGRALPGGRTIVYRPIRALPRAGTDWLVVRREAHDPEPEPVVEDPRGNRYALRRRFPSFGPSGADWYVYAPLRGRAPPDTGNT